MSEMSAQHVASPLTFRFIDVGPVKDATLRLGRFTVIAGGNNTGKTCLASCIYTLILTWEEVERIPRYLLVAPEDFPSIEGIAETLVNRGRAVIPLDSAALQRQRRVLVTLLGRVFSVGRIRQAFGSAWPSFRGARVMAELNDPGPDWMPTPISCQYSGATISMSYDGDRLIATMTEEDPPDPMEEIEHSIASTYYPFLLRDLFPRVFNLTADRGGVALFHRNLDPERDEVLDLLYRLHDVKARTGVNPFQLLHGKLAGHTRPINDNLEATRHAWELGSAVSRLPADRTLAARVRDMAGGHFRGAGGDIRFVGTGQGADDGFDLPVQQASSSARSLSDLYFQVRFASSVGDLLIIDGPETHLDAQNQVRMARLLARCVTAGLSVLVTTHSDHLLKEVNNLIMLGGDFRGRAALARRLGYHQAERLDPKLVRAYVAEDGGLTECRVGAHGIDTSALDVGRERIDVVADEISSRVDAARTSNGD